MERLDPEIERLVARLDARPVSLRQIDADTGLGWHWLRALSERRIKSPGYQRVRRLHDHLDSIGVPENPSPAGEVKAEAG